MLGFDDDGQGARAGRRRRDPGAPTSTRTSRRALDWLGERCPSVGAAGHCTGGHIWRSGRRSTRASAGPSCWYPTGLHDGKLGKEPTPTRWPARGEIDGELLLIFGTRDPHTPLRGPRDDPRRARRAGTRFTLASSIDAEHAFGRDIGPRFDPEATDLAFAETIAFFRRTL